MGLFDGLFGRSKSEPSRPSVVEPAQTDVTWQVPFGQQVCIAMIRIIPEEWDTVYMTLAPGEDGLGSGMSHSAITRLPAKDGKLEKGTDFVMPTMEVFAATRRLELEYVKRKWRFKRAIASAKRDSEGGWDIRIEYEHDD